MKFPYLSINTKFSIAVVTGTLWAWFAFWIAQNWILQLSMLWSPFAAYFIVIGLAIIPGFMNAFLVMSLFIDKRPKRKTFEGEYPPVTILVAAYNESDSISGTLESISLQQYPGQLKVIVINDGSTDNTAELVASVQTKYPWLALLDLKKNVGKAEALNQGLKLVETELMITVDGDSYLFKDALVRLVERYLSDPVGTAAVAGAVLVRNSRHNFVAAIQEWDYFHGIAAVKRVQSLYHGALVAQGAFSLYNTRLVRDVNAWPSCVGEDIVLTWAILRKGYRIGYAEDACLFTNAPTTWNNFFKQRVRWARGLIEAFKAHWPVLFRPHISTLFIWLNLLFPYIDGLYSFVFIPGIVAAFFGIYWIVGPMILLMLPLALLQNWLMYSIQSKMFKEQGLKVRRNFLGFCFYAPFYGLLMQPFCVVGYIKEIFNGAKKNWGTK